MLEKGLLIWQASTHVHALSGEELGNLESSACKLDNISLQSNDISIKERLRANFEATYQMRGLKSEGAIIDLGVSLQLTSNNSILQGCSHKIPSG